MSGWWSRLTVWVLTVLFALPAHAGAVVAVLNIDGSASALQAKQLDVITNAARDAVRQALPDSKVMTSDTTEAVLRDAGTTLEACLENAECSLDIFREMQADVGLTGTLVKFGSNYTVEWMAYHVSAKNLLGRGSQKVDSVDNIVEASAAAAQQAVSALGKTEPVVARVFPKPGACEGWAQKAWVDTGPYFSRETLEEVLDGFRYGRVQAEASLGFVTLSSSPTVTGLKFDVRGYRNQRAFAQGLEACGREDAVPAFEEWRGQRRTSNVLLVMLWPVGLGTALNTRQKRDAFLSLLEAENDPAWVPDYTGLRPNTDEGELIDLDAP